MTRETVRDVLEAANIGFRTDAIEFFNICKKDNINLSIVTGGLSDVIATMLSTVINIYDYPNLKIWGNELIFKDDVL